MDASGVRKQSAHSSTLGADGITDLYSRNRRMTDVTASCNIDEDLALGKFGRLIGRPGPITFISAQSRWVSRRWRHKFVTSLMATAGSIRAPWPLDATPHPNDMLRCNINIATQHGDHMPELRVVLARLHALRTKFKSLLESARQNTAQVGRKAKSSA